MFIEVQLVYNIVLILCVRSLLILCFECHYGAKVFICLFLYDNEFGF